MKRKIFVWHPSLPGNLQSVAPLRSCAFLVGAAGPRKGVGLPEGAFWAPQQEIGAAAAGWGSVGAERGWALGPPVEGVTGAGWGPGCAQCWHWRVGGWWDRHRWPSHHSCQHAKGSRVPGKAKPLCRMSSSASATGTAAITKATKLPEFSSSKTEEKISDGRNLGC